GEATARQLAITLICELEGAFLLCRAMKSTEPMEIAGANAAAAARDALG
ncbi:MAG: TetR/AcrR family transcriptional regulator, partial [Solirubrobacterales bacterium]